MRLSVPSRRLRVEMTPLMDIVFLLLVFFIYAMLMMAVHRGMPMALPTSSMATPETETRLSVSVKADGSVYCNKTNMTLDQLRAALIEHRNATPDRNPVVQVFGEDRLEYQQLYRVLDVLKSAGIARISLQAVRR